MFIKIKLNHRGTEIVPLRVLYYGQPNSAPRGTVSVPFFSECMMTSTLLFGVLLL